MVSYPWSSMNTFFERTLSQCFRGKAAVIRLGRMYASRIWLREKLIDVAKTIGDPEARNSTPNALGDSIFGWMALNVPT